MNTALWIWVIGWVLLALLVFVCEVGECVRRNAPITADNVVVAMLVCAGWPAVFLTISVLTLAYSITWMLYPPLRGKDGLIQGIKDFWC